MSQSPNQPPQIPTPYQPPSFTDYRNSPQLPDLLAPGRRAAAAMFILGGLALACGTLFGAAIAKVPDAVLNSSPNMKLYDSAGLAHPPVQLLRQCATGVAVAIVLVGVAYVVSGLFVRRGSRAAAIVGIILSGLGIGAVLLDGIFALFASGDVPTGVCSIAFVGVLVPVFVTLIRWLAQSLPAARQLSAYRQQLALQQMYFYQQQQNYQQFPPSAAPPAGDTLPDYTPPPPPTKPGQS